jgi:hypothetical protein
VTEMEQLHHLTEARRLTALANSEESKEMGRIERAMYLTEANNHLLWALLEEVSL